MQNINVKSVPPKNVVALCLHTTFVQNKQAKEIPPFFHRVMEEGTLETVPNRSNENQICVIVKQPDSPEFDYYMGVEVDSYKDVPEGMVTLDVPANQYAMTDFVKRGNADVLGALKFVTEEWLPESGFVQNFEAPLYVYYNDRFIPIYKKKGYAGNPIAEIYVPVKTK